MEPLLASDTKSELLSWHSARRGKVCDIWDDLVARDPGARIFSYREWFHAAAAAGVLTRWSVLIIHAGGRPIALFPLRKLSPWSWQVMSYMGQGNLQAVIDPACEEIAWQGVAGSLRETLRAQMLSLETNDEQQAERCMAAGVAYGLHATLTPVNPPIVVSRLEPNWEAFERKMGASTAKHLRRAVRLLKEGYPDYRMEYVTSPAVCGELLPELIRWYRLHWGKRLFGCQFDDPRTVDFYRRVVAWAAERGYLVMSVMRVREQPVVLHIMFHLPGQETLYQHLISRDMDALPNRYSPGLVESVETARWAIEHGIACLDQGIGDLPYKLMLAGEKLPRWKVTLATSPARLHTLSRLEHILRHLSRLPIYATSALRRVVSREQ